jgi:hypothetical protein
MTDDSLDILNKLDPNLNCNASSCVTKQKKFSSTERIANIIKNNSLLIIIILLLLLLFAMLCIFENKKDSHFDKIIKSI